MFLSSTGRAKLTKHLSITLNFLLLFFLFIFEEFRISSQLGIAVRISTHFGLAVVGHGETVTSHRFKLQMLSSKFTSTLYSYCIDFTSLFIVYLCLACSKLEDKTFQKQLPFSRNIDKQLANIAKHTYFSMLLI